jgi:hypothetical protein
MSWEGEKAYCAPPIALILKTIGKIEVSKMTGVLLIPLWRGARFWLHAFPDGWHLGGVFKSFRKLEGERERRQRKGERNTVRDYNVMLLLFPYKRNP